MNENSNSKLIVSELIDLLKDEKSCQDVVISTEIIKTIRLLVKQGESGRKEIISHPQVSNRNVIYISLFVYHLVDHMFIEII